MKQVGNSFPCKQNVLSKCPKVSVVMPFAPPNEAGAGACVVCQVRGCGTTQRSLPPRPAGRCCGYMNFGAMSHVDAPRAVTSWEILVCFPSTMNRAVGGILLLGLSQW